MDEIAKRLLVELIDKKLVHRCCQLCIRKDGKYVPYGSAVCLKIGFDYYLLTNAHVATVYSDSSTDLFVKINNKGFVNITGDIVVNDFSNRNDDVAFIHLAEFSINFLLEAYVFIGPDDIATLDTVNENFKFCALGFQEKDKTSRLKSSADLYLSRGAKLSVYKKYHYNENDFIIIDLGGRSSDIVSGQKAKINTHFYGMSGGALYLIYYTENPLTFELEINFKLVGILSEYKNGKYLCLVAIKIQLFLQFISKIENKKIFVKAVIQKSVI